MSIHQLIPSNDSILAGSGLTPTISIDSSINSSLSNFNSPIRKHRFDDRSQTKISLALQNHKQNTLEAEVSNKSTFDISKNANLITENFMKWAETEAISKIINSPHFIKRHGTINYVEPSSIYIVLGTDKGSIIGFNYRQGAEFILESNDVSTNDQQNDSNNTTEDDEVSRNLLGGSITAITFSSDSSFLAAGFDNGKIILWDLSSSNGSSASIPSTITPFFIIYPISLENRFSKSGQGHLINVAIKSINFIGDLHSNLVSSDISGLVFFHNGFKKFLTKHFLAQKLLGKNDANIHDSSGKYLIHDCSVLPLGSSHQLTDQIGLLAVMTGNMLAIISILSLNNPHNLKPITHFKIGKSKYVTKQNNSTASTTGCLCWYPCMEKKSKKVENSKLAYAWNNILTILEIRNDRLPANLMSVIGDLKDKDKAIPKFPIDKTARWACPNKYDNIISIKWLSSDILLIGIKTHETGNVHFTALYYTVLGDDSSLLVVGEDNLDENEICKFEFTINENNTNERHVTESVISPTYTSYNNSIKFFKNRLMLLSNDQSKKIIFGRCSTWADRLVEHLSAGNYSLALLAANEYYNSTNTGQLVLAGLPNDPESRSSMVKPYLIDIMNETIPHLFSNFKYDHDYFLAVCFDIISYLSKDTKDDLSNILESLFESYKDKSNFFKTLESYILAGGISSLPPIILKELVEYYISNGKGEELTEIICILDTKTLDIDLTLTLCKKYNLRDCSIYIWTKLLQDYSTPLIDFIKEIRKDCDDLNDDLQKVYPYMSYILTGRQYPTDKYIEQDQESFARSSVCNILFSVTFVDEIDENTDTIFPYLYILLKANSFEMLSTLNEFFENPCLNDNPNNKINRQYIIEALLDIYESNKTSFDHLDNIQLSIFIARNYPKYPQFIRLSESVLNKIVDDLCSNTNQDIFYDCELALQSILPLYETEDDTTLIEKLKAARFYDVLINIYRVDNKHDKVLKIWLERQKQKQKLGKEFQVDSLSTVFESFFNLTHSITDRLNVLHVIKENFKAFLQIDTEEFFKIINKFYPSIHNEILLITDDDLMQYNYLTLLFSTKNIKELPDIVKLVSVYIKLLCKLDKTVELVDFVSDNVHILARDRSEFDEIKDLLKLENKVDSLSVLYIHDHDFQEALNEIIEMMIRTTDISNEKDDSKENFINKFNELFECALNICEHPDTYKKSNETEETLLNETMWLYLIENLVVMANSTLTESTMTSNHKTEFINKCIHRTFRKVIDTKLDPRANDNEKREKSFLVIFNKFLEHSSKNAKIATLSNVRAILQDVFISYSYESEILSISLNMINDGIYKSMKQIKNEKLKGWDIKSKICTSCGKTMWGDEVLSDHYKAWEAKESDALIFNRVKPNELFALPFDKEKFLHCELIYFKCSHGYHSKCLLTLTSKSSKKSCVICSS